MENRSITSAVYLRVTFVLFSLLGYIINNSYILQLRTHFQGKNSLN